MFSALVVCTGLLAAVSPDPEAVREYEQARVEVGRNPDAHVKLALWCEARGMEAERVKHLALAVLHDPAHATARGLLGLVAYRNQWQPPDAVAAKVKADDRLAASLAEYNARRAKTPETADAQWILGLWCERQGLKAEAAAHFTAVTRLDPTHDAAWKKLGCKTHHGRWMTPEQIAAEIAESEAQRLANQHWQARLERWRTWLVSPDESKREEAESLLAGVTDPRAVPSVWKAFGKGAPELQARAVRLLGQIQAPAASRALAMLAISAEADDLRQTARATLTKGDPRDYVGELVELLRDPIRYHVQPVAGPGHPGTLVIEGDRFNLQRVYAPPPLPKVKLSANDTIDYDPYGLPVIIHVTGTTQTRIPGTRMLEVRAKQDEIPIGRMVAETIQSARVAQKQLESDLAPITRYNDRVEAINGRTMAILEEATGGEFSAEDSESWREWWNDQQGYSTPQTSTVEKPTLVQNVRLAYTPQSRAISTVGGVVGYRRGHACFGAGTPVRTLAGPRPIETLRVGDQVLTQDTTTGALSYQPIVAVHHNPPNQTLRLTLGGETVVATAIHRFWRAGRGWAMARDLKPGDSVRTLGGTVKVEAVSDDQTQPVFNLEVAHGQSFFVGRSGLLVHDNSLVQPTPNPFDAPPSLAALVKDRR